MKIALSPATKIHILKHFISVPDEYLMKLEKQCPVSVIEMKTRLEIPGSKFNPLFAQTPDEILDKIICLLKSGRIDIEWTNGKSEFTYSYSKKEFPDGIGVDCLINRSQIASLPEHEFREIIISGYPVPTIKYLPERTHELTVILKHKEGKEVELITAFPGKLAPPFPNVFPEKSVEYRKSKKFWDEHVFVTY